MFDRPFSERFKYLLDAFQKKVPDVVEGTGLSKSFLYYLLNGEREEMSQESVEKIAEFFGISPLFFSRNAADWVPPVSGRVIQYALRTSGELDEQGRAMLEQLMKRAQDLAEKPDDDKSKA